jgi:Xaa-Pro aminopeptidase
VHVLANSGDCVPAGFPVEHLFGITWNPEKMLDAARDRAWRSVRAVDGMTPIMHALLSSGMPEAQLVDAAPVLTDLRARPDPDRLVGVRAAAEAASSGLAAMIAELRPGVRPRTLRGACAEAFASWGVTTPAFEAVASPLEAGRSTWLPPDRPIREHQLVVLRAGALRDGWEASVARTYKVHHSSPMEQPRPEQWDALVAACIAGAKVGELRARGAILFGVGRGVEPWDEDYVLPVRATCALEVAGPQSVRQDVLLLTADGVEPIT